MLKANKGEQLQMNMGIKTLYHLLLVCLALSLLVGCTASPATPAPPSGEELASYQIEIDLLGARHEVSVDIQGRLKTSAQVTSADDIMKLSIDSDTILLDKDGKPLQIIQATVDPNPPPPPEDAYIVGAVYDLRPQGSTFEPPLKLTLSYDPEEMPGGVRESDVYIAPYDEGTGWGKWYYKRVDTENHRVATQIDHFARYAVLAPKEPPKSSPQPSPQPDLTSMSLGQALSSGKPTLAEFGRGTCIPCKAMKPILEELALEYKGKLNVVIVEIDEHRDLTNQYGIMAIPTQIFFDSGGKEVTKHMGFWAKEEIIAQLQKMGID
ncbi:thioredoxin family protein [Chloroflexota bacterium]